MDENVSKLWRVYKTVHEMVADRGYLVSKAELGVTLEQFAESYSSGGLVE